MGRVSGVSVRRAICRWLGREDGTALTEAVLIFPVLLSLFMGVWDIGTAFVINHKVITAAQTCADLIARLPHTNAAQRAEAIEAARLAMDPYPSSPLAYDIASVRFDESGISGVEHETSPGMSPNMTALEDAEGLGSDGEGVIVVTMQYTYTPTFGRIIMEEIVFEEVAFARGRKDSIVEFND